MSLRYFAFDIVRSIFCIRYFVRRYFAYSIFCHSIFCDTIFCDFDILRIRYFAIRYFATSIFCGFDILRFRYFAFDILRSIFCDSIFCFSIFCPEPVQRLVESFRMPPRPTVREIVSFLRSNDQNTSQNPFCQRKNKTFIETTPS